MAAPPPPNGEAPTGNAGNAAPAGAFAKRFPRLSSNFTKYSKSPFVTIPASAWKRRRPIIFGLAITYGVVSYAVVKKEARIRDTIHPDSWLVLRVYPGSIVEAKKAPTLALLLSSPSSGEDFPPKVMELFEVCRAIKMASNDERIRGLFADFSGLHLPSGVSAESLGMAQLEELVETIHHFKVSKKEQHLLNQAMQVGNKEAESKTKAISDAETEAFNKEMNEGKGIVAKLDDSKPIESISSESKPIETGQSPVTTIAWADSFDSQGSYLLASAFDHVYLQPSGSVPLTGVSMQIPFVKRALDWLGVKVYAEARKEFKSMVSTFIQADGLPPAQLKDEARLLGELSRGLAHAVGVNRFPEMEPEEAANRVVELTKRGPFAAEEALKEGLISGIKYRSEVIKELGKDTKLKSLSSYARISDNLIDRSLRDDEKAGVAVVYLTGTISNAPGDFTASSAIKGLREAGEDDSISSIVLRIDSGGGDVVASDSIWDAVRRVQEEYKKPVVASFGNASASGGYYASAGADAIMACESTITGSIGVASLRPTITKKLFDRVGISLQTLFTGSKMNSSIHEMSEAEKDRHSLEVDKIYETFIDKVCTGRKISKDVIEELAGGRVWTGLAALVRCKPDQELVKTEADAKVGATTGLKASIPVKVVSLSGDWKTIDVTQEGEMSTYRIEAATTPAMEKIREEVKEMVGQEESSKQEGTVTTGSGESALLDDEAKLASAAHQEAEASHKEGAATTEEKPAMGPYGRGLIDYIGGIWDATYLAMTLALQREVEELVKGGMTMEQATNSVRPGWKRETAPDGSVSLSTDLRLVRYPKEKNWRERIREIQKNEEGPTLSLLPGFGNVALQLREFCTDVAMRILIKSWQDPAMIQRMMSEVEAERKVKMEYHSSMRM